METDPFEEHLRECAVCAPMLEDYLEIKRLKAAKQED